MKKLKIFRVINDTHNSHGMVNTFVRFAWNGDEETIIAKDTKTGKLIHSKAGRSHLRVRK